MGLTWFHFMILFPFLFAIIIPFLLRKPTSRLHLGWIVLFVPIFLFVYLVRFIPKTMNGETFFLTMPWIPSAGINFTAYIDGLSLIFGLLITGVGALVILYSIYYLSKDREALHNFYLYILLFMGAMLGVVFSDNLFVLYVFWELTSISSFLLIAYWYERKSSRYGAQKSMLITIFGGFSMLAGFIMLSMITGTNSMRELMSQKEIIFDHPLFLVAMILVLLGAFTKSAQYPFSIWLPDAMEAPTPISAYLHSATMVKAGIYLVARFTPVFGGSAEWFWIVSIVGLITLLYGSVTAVRQIDLKALLAYSTISQLGLIMCLLGLGSAAVYYGGTEESTLYAVAILAAIFHLVNHSTFKGSLFMVVGIIDHGTGTRNIRRLGGLMTVMPITFTIALIGSFSMAGLPPFNGFLSKEMFFTGVLNSTSLPIFGMDRFGVIFPVIAWIASIFTFIYCMIFLFKTFTGNYHPERLDKEPHEAPIGMLIAPVTLASLVILLFFFPNILSDYLLQPALTAILPAFAEAGGLEMHITAWHGFDNPELWMTIGVIVFGTLMYLTFKKWQGIFRIFTQEGRLNILYNGLLEKMESFSRNLTNKYMTDSIRDYLVYIFTTLILVVGGGLLILNGYSINLSNNAPITIYEAGIVIGMVLSGVIVVFAKSRLTAIIALGALGYLVAILFVIFRAPDLALTQLVVETATVVLFLLCFYHLPKYKRKNGEKGVGFNPTNLLISLGVGGLVTVLALSANGNRLFEPISEYFQDAYELAGAKNIVNSILVDFRGFDTMLEVVVLMIAGLGVYSLIKVRLARREEKSETSE